MTCVSSICRTVARSPNHAINFTKPTARCATYREVYFPDQVEREKLIGVAPSVALDAPPPNIINISPCILAVATSAFMCCAEQPPRPVSNQFHGNQFLTKKGFGWGKGPFLVSEAVFGGMLQRICKFTTRCVTKVNVLNPINFLGTNFLTGTNF